MARLNALLREFIHDLGAHRLRAALTMLAFVWGTAAVVLLLAFGTGLKRSLMESITNSGDGITRLYGGTTSRTWKGFPKGRDIHFVEEDVEILREAVPGIRSITPAYGRYDVQVRHERNKTSGYTIGVYPEIQYQRSMYPEYGGRFISEADMREKRRVLVLGSEIVEKLFGDVDPVGRTVILEGMPFTVIGQLQDKKQMGMSNGPDSRRVIMPASVYRSMFSPDHVHHIIIQPEDPSRSAAVNEDVLRILSAKYKFDPDDSRAYFAWDQAERRREMRMIALGLTIFLGVVGGMTLVIAGVGVANIMLVIVRERTREIGVKLAVGARRRDILAQFLFEAVMIAFTGGAVGLLFAGSVIGFIQSLPPTDNFGLQLLGRPVMSLTVTLVTVAVLSIIAVVAGCIPARRAASVDPIESLRYE